MQDLAQYSETKLRVHFGLVGHYSHDLGNLQGSAQLVTVGQEVTKSVGHAFTMPQATTDLRIVKKLLFKLSEKVAVRLRRQNFWGSRVSCYVRYQLPPGQSRRRYTGAGQTHKIGELVNDGRLIYKHAFKIFNSFRSSLAVRMVGVTVSGLAGNVRDEPLFARYKKLQWVLSAMDRVNAKYGDFTLRRAMLADARHLAGDTVGFGGMKEMKLESV